MRMLISLHKKFNLTYIINRIQYNKVKFYLVQLNLLYIYGSKPPFCEGVNKPETGQWVNPYFNILFLYTFL
jgi:hypothetical protein